MNIESRRAANRRALVVASLSLAFFALAADDVAAPKKWGGKNGEWTKAANWKNADPPKAKDDAVVAKATAEVVRKAKVSCADLAVAGAANAAATVVVDDGELRCNRIDIGHSDDDAATAGAFVLKKGEVAAAKSIFVDGSEAASWIQNDGKVSAGAVVVGISGTGAYELKAGTLKTGSLTVAVQGAALFDQTGGEVEVTGAQGLSIAYSTASSGTYSISKGKLKVAKDLYVGPAGEGTFKASGTANVTIGGNANVGSIYSEGVMELTGGSTKIAGDLTLGDHTLRVEGNGAADGPVRLEVAKKIDTDGATISLRKRGRVTCKNAADLKGKFKGNGSIEKPPAFVGDDAPFMTAGPALTISPGDDDEPFGELVIGGDAQLDGTTVECELGYVAEEELESPGVTHDTVSFAGQLAANGLVLKILATPETQIDRLYTVLAAASIVGEVIVLPPPLPPGLELKVVRTSSTIQVSIGQ